MQAMHIIIILRMLETYIQKLVLYSDPHSFNANINFVIDFDPKVQKDDAIPSAVSTTNGTTIKLAPVSPAKPIPSTSTPLHNGSSNVANGHSDKPALPLEIPKSLGSDVEAVAWVNEGIKKGFTDPKITKELIKMWLNSLTQYTKSSGAEVCKHRSPNIGSQTLQ